MGTIRDRILGSLWHGHNPYADFDREANPTDKQGWGSTHRYLEDSVKRVGPKVIIEIGVWKGGSVITLAKALRDAKIDGAVIAIDTWLGSSEHWLKANFFSSLNVKNGYPSLQKTFLSNILDEGLEDYVIPFPIDSANAVVVATKLKWQAQVIHIDAGHDYYSVSADIRAWWPVLQSGGILIGDDYRTDGVWPGVKRAFDEFAEQEGVALENIGSKCRLLKP